MSAYFALALLFGLGGPSNGVDREVALVQSAYKNLHTAQARYVTTTPGIKASEDMSLECNFAYQGPDTMSMKLTSDDQEVATFIVKGKQTLYMHVMDGGTINMPDTTTPKDVKPDPATFTADLGHLLFSSEELTTIGNGEFAGKDVRVYPLDWNGKDWTVIEHTSVVSGRIRRDYIDPHTPFNLEDHGDRSQVRQAVRRLGDAGPQDQHRPRSEAI